MFNDKILSNIKTYFLVLLIFFFFIIITIPSFKIDAALKDPTPKKDIEKK
jgi:hypothetical protein